MAVQAEPCCQAPCKTLRVGLGCHKHNRRGLELLLSLVILPLLLRHLIFQTSLHLLRLRLLRLPGWLLMLGLLVYRWWYRLHGLLLLQLLL